ncbi:hypothetical protein G6F43_008665 [Rhizopus delemar]|nr:hypothetical protein G6F43_008665 [Rhizopus delemar]
MQTAILPVVFLKALSNQSSETIEAVSVNQDARQGVVAALDSVEAQTKACSTGVRVENITIIGTPTLSTNSSIYRISLEILLILRPGELTPLLRQVLSQYGKVLHVGILLDPATNLFFGKGYVIINIVSEEGFTFREL